jgi:hypothetical protein
MPNELAHRCPGTGCKRRVPGHRLACPHHWFKVSPATRRRVWDTYLHEADGTEHDRAIADAIEEMNE